MSKKQQKGHRGKSPQGGWGMGSKEAIQKIILLIVVTISENWYNFSWSLYGLKSRDYKVRKSKVLVKWETPGGIWTLLKTPPNRSFLYFLLHLIKNSEYFRIKYSQNHFKSTFGSAYLNSKKIKLKLAKQVKKEPRKARFPWDLGLLLCSQWNMHWYCRILNFIIQQMKLP